MKSKFLQIPAAQRHCIRMLIRKSFHFAILTIYMESRDQQEPFYIAASGLILLCLYYFEMFREQESLFPYYKATNQYISDSRSSTALNHIQLFEQSTIFPALQSVIYYSRNSVFDTQTQAFKTKLQMAGLCG